MHYKISLFLACLCSCPIFLATPPSARAQEAVARTGIFEGHGDIGAVLHPGAAEFDMGSKSYTVSGSGDNMWATKDAYQFVWKKVSGDLTLTADISFIGAGTDPHRKACL